MKLGTNIMLLEALSPLQFLTTYHQL